MPRPQDSSIAECLVWVGRSTPTDMNWLSLPQIKWFVPFPLLVAIAPLIWLFFR